MDGPLLLGCLPFLVFIFAVFGLKGIICVHFYLFLDDLLQDMDPSGPMQEAGCIVTVAWTPDCFRASISAPVRGWTNCPSFMSSFVASVSSVSRSLKDC
jgi:hypothetical protein